MDAVEEDGTGNAVVEGRRGTAGEMAIVEVMGKNYELVDKSTLRRPLLGENLELYNICKPSFWNYQEHQLFSAESATQQHSG